MKYKLHILVSAVLLSILALNGNIIIAGVIEDSMDKINYIPYDYSAFKSDDSAGIRFEVYYQIYNRMLKFEKTGDKYEADYEIMVVVNDKKGNLLDSYKKSRSFKVPSVEKAQSRYDFRTGQVNFNLDPGKYKVDICLIDNKDNSSICTDFKVNLKSFKSKNPKVSWLELVKAVGQKQEESSPFDKANYTLIPSISNIFGTDDDPRLVFYMEIYQGDEPMEKVLVETVLRHKVKGMVYRDTIYTDLNEPVTRQIREISLSDFVAGQYELYVYLKGVRNKKLNNAYKEFKVVWTQEALLRHEFKKALRQLAYLADKSEINKLKKAETYEERLAAFNEFWRYLDPVPETPTNEAKIEFYRRVKIANRNFSYLYREGWDTDRGMIYIQYGEPDQLDDYPIVHNRRPYQEWHYYRYEKYLRFTFVDENEDGDYRLIYPYDGTGQYPY